ncbi:MAG: hypothetical protein PVI04_10150, partial [Anaerolineales bacterium]
MFADEVGGALNRVLGRQVVSEGAYVGWAEVETTANARVDNDGGIFTGVLQRGNRGLDATPTLVLFLVAEEDQHRDIQLVDLGGVAIDLHGLGGVG